MRTPPAAAALAPSLLLELTAADERDMLIERGLALLQQAETSLGAVYSGPADALSELVHLSRRLHNASSIRAFCQQLQFNLSAVSNGSGDDDSGEDFLSDSQVADKPTAAVFAAHFVRAGLNAQQLLHFHQRSEPAPPPESTCSRGGSMERQRLAIRTGSLLLLQQVGFV